MFRIRVKSGSHFEKGKRFGKNDVFVSQFPLHEGIPDKFELVEDLTKKVSKTNTDISEDAIPEVEESTETREAIQGFDERFTLVQKNGDKKYRIYDELKRVNVGKNQKYMRSEVEVAIQKYMKGL